MKKRLCSCSERGSGGRERRRRSLIVVTAKAGGAAPVNHQSCLLSKQDRRSHRSHVSKEPTQQEAAQKVSGAVKLNFNL